MAGGNEGHPGSGCCYKAPDLPFTVEVKMGDAVISIDVKEEDGRIIFLKKVDGSCRGNEPISNCVARLAKLIVTYGDLTF